MAACKTSDPRIKLDEPKPEHLFQVITQIGLFQELTPHRPGYASMAYTDASFWAEVVEFAVGFHPEVFQTAKRRAARIMTMTTAETLWPEGLIAGSKECNLCFLSARHVGGGLFWILYNLCSIVKPVPDRYRGRSFVFE